MLRKLASRPDWQIALAITTSLRILFSAIAAMLSFFLHPDPALIRSNALTADLPMPGTVYYALLGVWERFDTLWYVQIAQHGYRRPMEVTFYPLYPLAIRLVSALMQSTAAALVVSTVAAFFSFWGLLRLANELSPVGKLRAILLVCVWPTSFVLVAGYAESLTLALVVWGVVFGREAQWEAATTCGLLAGLARPSGVLVFIPLAVMALRSRQARSLVVVLTPLGFLGYWSWLRWSGRISVLEAYRLYYGSRMVAPWTGVWRALRLIVEGRDLLLAIKLGLVIMVAGTILRRDVRLQVRLEDKAYALAVVFQMLMYTGHPLLGAARYLLMVYPAFLAWGAYAQHWNEKRFSFCLVALASLNLAFMWAFLSWSLVL